MQLSQQWLVALLEEHPPWQQEHLSTHVDLYEIQREDNWGSTTIPTATGQVPEQGAADTARPPGRANQR